jgi:hypothetical protein
VKLLHGNQCLVGQGVAFDQTQDGVPEQERVVPVVVQLFESSIAPLATPATADLNISSWKKREAGAERSASPLLIYQRSTAERCETGSASRLPIGERP